MKSAEKRAPARAGPQDVTSVWKAAMMPPVTFGAGTSWVQALTAMSVEVQRFVTVRMEEDIRLHHALMQCTSVEDMRSCQAEYIERAMVQYQDEALRLFDLGIRAWFPFKPVE